jgi:hypothetical protein
MRRHRGACCSFSERPPICSAGRGGDLDERGGVVGFAPGTMGSTFFADPSGLPEFLKATDTEGTTFEEALEAARRGLLGRSKAPLRHEVRAIRSLRSVLDVMDEVGIEEYISKRLSRTCEVAVRMSGPRVVDRTAVENQRWNGSAESGGPV